MILCENTGRKPWHCRCDDCNGGLNTKTNPAEVLERIVGPNVDTASFSRATAKLAEPVGKLSQCLLRMGMEMGLASEKFRSAIFQEIWKTHGTWVGTDFDLSEDSLAVYFNVQSGRHGFQIPAQRIFDYLRKDDPTWLDLGRCEPTEEEMRYAQHERDPRLRAAVKRLFESWSPAKAGERFRVYFIPELDFHIMKVPNLPRVRLASSCVRREADESDMLEGTRAKAEEFKNGDWDIHLPEPMITMDQEASEFGGLYGASEETIERVLRDHMETPPQFPKSIVTSPVSNRFGIRVEGSYGGDINGHAVKLHTEGDELWIESPQGRFRLA